MKEKTTGTAKRQNSAEKFQQTEGLLENTETSSEMINDMLYEIILSCEKVLYSALQFQEDTLKTWAHLLQEAGSPLPVQKELEVISSRIFPNARTRLDQVLEVSSLRLMLFNRASSQIIGLIGRATTLWNASSIPETWNQIDGLSQRFLKILSADSGIFINTNSKILKICKELADPQPFLAALSAEKPPQIPQGPSLRKVFGVSPGDSSKREQHQALLDQQRPRPRQEASTEKGF